MLWWFFNYWTVFNKEHTIHISISFFLQVHVKTHYSQRSWNLLFHRFRELLTNETLWGGYVPWGRSGAHCFVFSKHLLLSICAMDSLHSLRIDQGALLIHLNPQSTWRFGHYGTLKGRFHISCLSRAFHDTNSLTSKHYLSECLSFCLRCICLMHFFFIVYFTLHNNFSSSLFFQISKFFLSPVF